MNSGPHRVTHMPSMLSGSSNRKNWRAIRTWHNKTKEEWVDLVDLFLGFGADVNAVDEEFRATPLGWAARLGKKDMAAHLLDRGADPNAADAPWATPLAWVEKRGHRQIAQVLKNHGAKA